MSFSLLTSRFIAFALILLGLAGCAILPFSKPAIDPESARAQQFYQQQDYAKAATAYFTLAARHTGAKRQSFLLYGADAAFLGGDINAARAALEKLGPAALPQDEQLLHQVLQAEIALQEKQADLALMLLEARQPAVDAPLSLRKRYYRALSNSYQQTGETLLSAQNLQTLHDLLDDPEAQLAVQLDILRTLNLLSSLALDNYQLTPSDTMSGWVKLTQLNRQHRSNLQALQQALFAWRKQYSSHPAFLDELLAYQEQLYGKIHTSAHIGVLLPKSGRYAEVSEAIRDGMMVTLQQMPLDKRPVLSFYDSSNTQAIWPLYNEAIDKGADFIIGPLQKNAITQLIRAGELSTPVLALNIVNVDKIMPRNLYMYSLDPEDEARQAAERMWQDGKKRPVALVPKNAWGERLLNAFRQHWSKIGGRQISAQQYDPKSYDHTRPITRLLHINRSTARHSQLQRWLGMPLEFIPRRRTDVDAVFLATDAQQATAFAPQFKYHLAGDLPIYTTSHVWRGSINRQQLTDMRGLILPDIPLIADTARRAELAQQIPGVRGGLVRLYAMGIDALNLVPHLQRLQSSTYESLDGLTGNLYMDAENRIRRQLVWLKLDRPIRNLGYANRLEKVEQPTLPNQSIIPATNPQQAPARPNQAAIQTFQATASATAQNNASATAR